MPYTKAQLKNNEHYERVIEAARREQIATFVKEERDFVASGSNGGLQAATEIYDGTSWKNSSDVATARGECAGSKEGSTSSMTIAGGESPSRTNATEEFTAEFSVKTITDS